MIEYSRSRDNSHNNDHTTDSARMIKLNDIRYNSRGAFYMFENEMNICFAADDGYIVPTAAAIASVCYNSNSKIKYNIFVVMPAGCTENAKKAFAYSAQNYSNISVNIIECDISDLENLHKGDDTRYLSATKTALIKFRLPSVFNNLDKILYLDGDIIVKDDLASLFSLDISDYYAAAVRDLPQVLYKDQKIGSDISGKDYFNSGVMLLNLKKVREDNVEKRLIETKRSYTDYSLMDQNIFNIVFKDAVLQLGLECNACYVNLLESKDKYDIAQINKIYNRNYKNILQFFPDIKIVHFSSKLKPWYFYDVPFADEWLFYYRKTAFSDIKLQRISHTRRDVDIEKVKNAVNKASSETYDKFSKVIPVVFAGSEEYLYYAGTAIQSIYENSNPDYFYDISIFVDETVSEIIRNKLSSLKYKNIKINIYDIRNCLKGIDLYCVAHYSRQMYYRWLIPEVLSKYDKVIYLDCDVIVNTDIAELYDMDLKENYVAAANNFLRKNLLNHIKNRLCIDAGEYYNSGVLLINCKEWINRNLKNKCINCLKYYVKLPCPDQDVLNVICKGKIFRLDDRWNFQWHHQFSDARVEDFVLDYEERYNSLMNTEPYIIHYTSFIKPWEHPERAYAEYFWNSCRKSDFYEAVLFANIKRASMGLIKQGETEDAAKIRKQINKLQKSKTYKLSRLLGFIPRKLFHRDYLPIPEKGADARVLRKKLKSIKNSRSYKIALKIMKVPRKIKSVIK